MIHDIDSKRGETVETDEKGYAMNKHLFSSIFEVGEIIDSGGRPERANAARLRIVAIEDDFIEFQSVRSKSRKKFTYSYIDVVLRGFDRIDPNSIQQTIQAVLLEAGLKENLWTENYAYGFAKEIRRRLSVL
jgi:hypothetical protein